MIALVLYPFAPWEGGAAAFVGGIGATMGPIFGVIMVDYYLIRKGVIDVNALYQEHGAYRFQGGWSVAAFAAAIIGALFDHPAELHRCVARLVGYLWLVLRRDHRRRDLLRDRFGGAGIGAQDGLTRRRFIRGGGVDSAAPFFLGTVNRRR